MDAGSINAMWKDRFDAIDCRELRDILDVENA